MRDTPYHVKNDRTSRGDVWNIVRAGEGIVAQATDVNMAYKIAELLNEDVIVSALVAGTIDPSSVF